MALVVGLGLSIPAEEDQPTCGGWDVRDGGSHGAPQRSSAPGGTTGCFSGCCGPPGGGDGGGGTVLAPWTRKPTGAVALGAHGRATVPASGGFVAGVATRPRPPRWADAAVAHHRAAVGAPGGHVHLLAGGAGVAGRAETFGQVGDAAVEADDWKRGGGRRTW